LDGSELWPVINMLGGWASPLDVTMRSKTFGTVRRVVTVGPQMRRQFGKGRCDIDSVLKV
jgi:hypothetical protein